MNSPLDILLPYQRKWVDDDSRFKIGMWSRQTGKSFCNAAEIVRDCHLNPRSHWVVLSVGERQALEWIAKARQWTEAFQLAIESEEVLRDHAEALMTAAEIRYANGSRITAIPANPNTARGYAANLFLDEFAFHDKPDEIWKAIYPSISNPLKGEKKLRIVSTPNGRGNKFYELWTKNESYSKHKLTIHDAIAQGLPVNADELQQAIDDPDAWAQEYLCEFIDNTSVLLPYELIAACENEAAVETGSLDLEPGVQRYCGIDIGRKKDLTVCWTIDRLGDIFWTREILTLQNTPFREQFELLGHRIATATACAIDATGIGAMLAEELGRVYGSYRVEECTFTGAFKSEIMTNLRRTVEDKAVRIPINRTVREDLHSLQKITTASGAIRYAAPSTDDGHADRATALALALYRAQQTTGDLMPHRLPLTHNPRAQRRQRSLIG